MTQRYEKTSYYWNDIYEKQEVYNPSETRFNEDLESALNWVSQKGGTLMDFGSGDGKMLLRCLEKGGVKSIGVDLSFHAISLSRRSAAPHFENLRTKWIWGDVKSLFPLPDACVNGVILSLILDQTHPEDGLTLLRMTHRLLDKKGRLLLILNPYLEPSEVKAQALEPLLSDDGDLIENGYLTKDGLYRWNLSDEAVLALFEPEYQVKEQSVLALDDGTFNRLYLFELKN